MSHNLTQAQKERVREQLYQFLDAAARHDQVCPTIEDMARRLRVGLYTIEKSFKLLAAEGRVRYWNVYRKGVGCTRIVYIEATGKQTRERGMSARVGVAARRLATYDQTKRQEGQALDAKLYGPILKDVNWLRHRGWVVTVDRHGYRVGNSVISAADIVAKAARERRLAGVAQ